MGMKVATTCLHWSQPSVPHSPSSSSPQTLASAISSLSSKRRSFSAAAAASDGGALVCRYFHRLDRSALFGTPYSKLSRTGSWQELLSPRAPRANVIRRASSSSLDSFSDEDFSKQIEELASIFKLSDGENDKKLNESKFNEERFDLIEAKYSENRRLFEPVEPPSDWKNEIIPANIERKVNSLELPFSLKMIRRKKQVENGFKEAGESAYCSVKKAFSSMVFIIRELQSYTLQMRELLFYEDLQGILGRVQKEMHMSFVWLFQQVFSHTPTLMVYVMILLANYSVYSMANNTAIMTTAPPSQPYAFTTESVSVIDHDHSHGKQRFDSSAIKAFSVSSSTGKTASIGGNNGGGGKYKSIASGTEGDESFDGVSLNRHGTVVPVGGVSSTGNPSITSDAESVSEKKVTQEEEERRLWNSIVDEALRMEAEDRDESLDHETTSSFVAPFHVQIESDDHSNYFSTQMIYELALAQEPDNVLLLTNYAQFLYLVVHDYDRAEEFFKRAVKIVPKDAEAFNKYANFLWQARNNLWDAEQAFNEAISAAAHPIVSYYAANYAHFLWNTGDEDSCYLPPIA